MPGAPAPDQNHLEDRFWRTIDQWGTDALTLLESTDPTAVAKFQRERWAIFVLSLIFRDPSSLKMIDQAARDHYETGFAEFSERYDDLRQPHEPATFEEFIAAFDGPGISEYGATILRSFATNPEILKQLLSMRWEIVDVANPRVELMTSDRPVIRFKGLKDPDGLLILPLGPQRFFVAYNLGPQDMKGWINDSIVHGHFMESMNDFVVQSAVRFVYGVDEAGRAVAERYLRSPRDPVLTRW